MTKAKWSFRRQASPTGLGLFALAPIATGKRIIEYPGPVLTHEQATEGGKYRMTIDDKYVIDGTPRRNTARYINPRAGLTRRRNFGRAGLDMVTACHQSRRRDYV